MFPSILLPGFSRFKHGELSLEDTSYQCYKSPRGHMLTIKEVQLRIQQQQQQQQQQQ